jgi:hypothetical protein
MQESFETPFNIIQPFAGRQFQKDTYKYRTTKGKDVKTFHPPTTT